jgi:neuropeptide Y receptor
MCDKMQDVLENEQNSTKASNEAFQISEYVQVLIIVMYSIVTIIAVGGNGIVCYLVYAYKRMHTCRTILL